jgi:hypothetical protein
MDYNNILARIKNLEQLVQNLIKSNQTKKMIILDDPKALQSIKVIDNNGIVRVFIGKQEE